MKLGGKVIVIRKHKWRELDQNLLPSHTRTDSEMWQKANKQLCSSLRSVGRTLGTTHAAYTLHNSMNIWCFIDRRKKRSVATNCAVSSVLETKTENQN